jgi:hypothetical protein
VIDMVSTYVFDAARIEVAAVDRVVAEILRIGVSHRIRERAITVNFDQLRGKTLNSLKSTTVSRMHVHIGAL